MAWYKFREFKQWKYNVYACIIVAADEQEQIRFKIITSCRSHRQVCKTLVKKHLINCPHPIALAVTWHDFFSYYDVPAPSNQSMNKIYMCCMCSSWKTHLDFSSSLLNLILNLLPNLEGLGLVPFRSGQSDFEVISMLDNGLHWSETGCNVNLLLGHSWNAAIID